MSSLGEGLAAIHCEVIKLERYGLHLIKGAKHALPLLHNDP